MKQWIILACLTLIYGTASAQQDAQFSQYMFNGVYINPAYAGYRGIWNMDVFYRKQWVNFPGSPRTISFAVDGVANDKRIGLALQAIDDQIGATNSISVYDNYSFRFPVNEDQTKFLSFGIAAGAVQSMIDVNKLDPTTAADPTILSLARSKLLPDARVGVFYSTDKFYLGASADRLITTWFDKNKIERDYLNFNLHWYMTGGMLVSLSNEVIWKPSVLIKDNIQGPTSLDINNLFLFDKILWLGASYRTSIPLYNKPNLQSGLTKSADIIGMFNIYLSQRLHIGYSYDYSLNAKQLHSSITHELSVGYYFTPRDGYAPPTRLF